jgi:hypothetical protein
MKRPNYRIVEVGDEEGQYTENFDAVCDVPLAGQEDISCWREHGHTGRHECIAAWPPCQSCGGLDMHVEGCPQSELTTKEVVVVQWNMRPGPRCGSRRYASLDKPVCGLHKGHSGPHRDGGRAWDEEHDSHGRRIVTRKNRYVELVK